MNLFAAFIIGFCIFSIVILIVSFVKVTTRPSTPKPISLREWMKMSSKEQEGACAVSHLAAYGTDYVPMPSFDDIMKKAKDKTDGNID